jgi:hypothetical protein
MAESGGSRLFPIAAAGKYGGAAKVSDAGNLADRQLSDPPSDRTRPKADTQVSSASVSKNQHPGEIKGIGCTTKPAYLVPKRLQTRKGLL